LRRLAENSAACQDAGGSTPAATAAALAPTGTTSDVRILLYAIQDAAYTNYFNK
jgi:hypothetical protein